MNPAVEDEDLKNVLAASDWIPPIRFVDGTVMDCDPRPDWKIQQMLDSRDCAPDEWTPALLKAAALGRKWLQTENVKAAQIAERVEFLTRINRGIMKPIPGGSPPYETHLKCIGSAIVEALTEGDTAMLKALLDLVKRWKGEKRKINPKPIQLAVIQEAFTLWRILERNPTRAELWAACEARDIKVCGAANKRSLLQKTALQFLA
jgi:hypothetical protein